MVEFCTVNGTYWTLRTNLVNPKRFLLRHVQYQNFQVNGTAWTKQRFGLMKSIFLIDTTHTHTKVPVSQEVRKSKGQKRFRLASQPYDL